MELQVSNSELETDKKMLIETLRSACKKIAPVWSLENFVAVNPYLGHIDQSFDSVAEKLSKVGGIQMTLPVSFYRNKIVSGEITTADLEKALSNKPFLSLDVDSFIDHIEHIVDADNSPKMVSTFVDVASKVTEKDWNRFVVTRISTWAASYFDNGQAMWIAADQKSSLFASWKAEGSVDLTPKVHGLSDFRNHVKSLPNDPISAIETSLKILDIPQEALSLYLHRLLVRVGGWAGFVARLDFENELQGGKDGKLMEFLAVLVCWEACLFQSMNDSKLGTKWLAALTRLSTASSQTDIDRYLATKLILQEAFDVAKQRDLISKFTSSSSDTISSPTRPKAQAIFCIDVRSEVFRRNLEMVDQDFETLGFAGFFAFPINYVPIAHDKGEALFPVLINAGPTIMEEIPNAGEQRKAYEGRVLKHNFDKLLKSFKSGAVSCFSFVSPLGLSYLPKLFTDSFGLTRPVPHPDKDGLSGKQFNGKSISLEVRTHDGKTTGIPLEQRVQMGRNALKAMSLTENFAPFVLITGHASNTVNNPHASGLDCGACGGHSGEANAKVAAAVLNDVEVRKQLVNEGLDIPQDTIFLACLHDTTTDEISIFNTFDVPSDRTEELDEIIASLKDASRAARAERGLRMSIDSNADKSVIERSKDWSQIRPEWGLAGCSTFVVAPRKRTQHIDLAGRSFLHSYEWKKDTEFSVLELIMTAPMVVTSWINLQYFASTVDNKNYGAGNKTLHNVTAGVGVLEGASGDLRVGLPMQSVHDGENFQHEPAKLKVVIEAPIEAMDAILEKHAMVKNLCKNGWIYLFVMNEDGTVSHRFTEDGTWAKVA